MTIQMNGVRGVLATRGTEARRLFFLGFLFGAVVLCGCGGSDPGVSRESPPDSPGPLVVSDDERAIDAGYESLGESRVQWRVTHISGAKLGHTRIVSQDVRGPDGPAVRIEITDNTRITRFGQDTKQRYRVVSLLAPSGELIAFQGELASGDSVMRTRGQVQDARLQLKSDSGKELLVETIDWDPAWRGLGGDEIALRQTALQPGESRSLTMLAPVLHQPIEVSWQALDWTDLTLPDGRTVRALEIMESANIGEVELEGVRWIDETGETLMQTTPSLGQTTYGTDEATAKSEQGASFDLGRASVVKIEKPLKNPHETRRIVYRVQLKHADPLKSFAEGVSQRVRRTGDHSAEVEVLRIRPTVPEAVDTAELQPSEGDLSPSPLIQSNSPDVIRLAEKVDTQDDQWQMAKDLEKLVHGSIEKKNYSLAVASAADVARQLEGDCTEHAVLLAALCRAKKIPARVAIGLVYYPAENGFAYHMWNEVWVNQRWTALDATLGLGGIGAAHLKVTSSSLTGSSPYEAFLKVIPLIHQLEVSVISAE